MYSQSARNTGRPAAYDPQYDPAVGANPEKNPKQALTNIREQARAKRAERQQQRTAAPTPAQQNTLKAITEDAPRTRIVAHNSTDLRKHGRLGSGRNVTQIQTLPVISTADEIRELGIPVKDNVLSVANKYLEGTSDATQQAYYDYEDAAVDRKLYAGLAAVHKEQEEGAYRVVIIDDSYSTKHTDTATPPRRDEGYNEVYGRDSAWNVNGGAANRITEAKQRLKRAMPLEVQANTTGTLRLTTFSQTPRAKNFDMRARAGESNQDRTQRLLREINSYIDSVNYRSVGTPTTRYLLSEMQKAVSENRLDRTKITLLTDGEANSSNDADHEFADYERNVVQGGRDFVNVKGQTVPNEVARSWYMDADSKREDRKISFLIGKFGIPVVIAACTNDSNALGELNEMDGYHSGGFSQLGVLDDPDSESLEVLAHNPDIHYTPDMADVRMWRDADVSWLDALDERRLTPDEMEQLTGREIDLDAYERATNVSEMAQAAKHQRYQPAPSAPPAWMANQQPYYGGDSSNLAGGMQGLNLNGSSGYGNQYGQSNNGYPQSNGYQQPGYNQPSNNRTSGNRFGRFFGR